MYIRVFVFHGYDNDLLIEILSSTNYCIYGLSDQLWNLKDALIHTVNIFYITYKWPYSIQFFLHCMPIVWPFIHTLRAFGFFPSKRQASVTTSPKLSRHHTLEAIFSLQATHTFGFVTVVRRFPGSDKLHIPRSVILTTKTFRTVYDDWFRFVRIWCDCYLSNYI